MAGPALLGLLCGLLIGTVVGAVFLRAAISLYNKLVGGPGSPSIVPEPDFGKAMGITFVTSLVNGVVAFLIGMVMGAGAAGAGVQPGGGLNLVAQGIAFVVSLFVGAGMLAAMLPTTFSRGLLVILCYGLIVIVVVGILALFAMLVLGATLMRRA
jgi:hypothetical protein